MASSSVPFIPVLTSWMMTHKLEEEVNIFFPSFRGHGGFSLILLCNCNNEIWRLQSRWTPTWAASEKGKWGNWQLSLEMKRRTSQKIVRGKPDYIPLLVQPRDYPSLTW